MTIFDILFINIFQYYKAKKYKKAIKVATFYVSFLQCSLLLLLGIFFAGFFRQMHVNTMSSSKAWILFVLIVIVVFFKNWMQYSGKKRNLLNAKMLKRKKQTYNIWVLWLLPVFILGLGYVLSQAA
ncbi:hypothetical protein EYD45_09695 [Hyunsoonleella flava]|uniref:DUF4271 domain-containing protein n=1 Tax=Hyunsoonleella flava TaxID=2527939 RepID=A0A4Q9FE45_9FLAO|nr:hypothetical protein [Hyunsoonleella flava]TBN03273.1 hypothetical protein EYD45_09695 [Hyunsoonleella flava]